MTVTINIDQQQAGYIRQLMRSQAAVLSGRAIQAETEGPGETGARRAHDLRRMKAACQEVERALQQGA